MSAFYANQQLMSSMPGRPIADERPQGRELAAMPGSHDFMTTYEILQRDYRELERENTVLRKDKERLDWMRHHVSGKEFRRIGICMENSGDLDELRQRIDDISENESSAGTGCSSHDLLSSALRAICLTRDYVGESLLPAIKGWEWFDVGNAIAKEIPNDEWAEQFQIRVALWRESRMKAEGITEQDIADTMPDSLQG